jgi:NTP pyrophosphatase (non-canonical NTP hydrolase)
MHMSASSRIAVRLTPAVPPNQKRLRRVTVRMADSRQPIADSASRDITLREFQQLIRNMYLEKDVARGIDGTFMWFIEEVGELATALREETLEEQAAEFADVFAWLTTLANVAGVDLTAAIHKKYGEGCPGCGHLICTCDDAEKR